MEHAHAAPVGPTILVCQVVDVDEDAVVQFALLRRPAHGVAPRATRPRGTTTRGTPLRTALRCGGDKPQRCRATGPTLTALLCCFLSASNGCARVLNDSCCGCAALRQTRVLWAGQEVQSPATPVRVVS